jgi:hypothetical protein
VTAYATLRDVYDLGFTAQTFVVRPRALDARAGDFLDAATGTFSMIGHGLAEDDLVRIVLVASGGSIPGGGSVLSTYYPLPLDYWRFRLSTTQGGSAVTFSSAGTSSGGTSAWGIQIDPERRLSRLAESMSREIDQDLTAHADGTPLRPNPTTGLYHPKVVAIVARMVARRATRGLTFENAAFREAQERVFKEEERDEAQREAWRRGQPLYPTPLDQNEVADHGATATNSVVSGHVADMPWLTGYL